MAEHLRLEIDNTSRDPHSLKRKDGGDPPGGDMEARVRELEKGHAVVVERINSLERRMDDRFDGVSLRFDGVSDRFDGVSDRFDGVSDRFDGLNKRFDDLNGKIDKLPNEWAMARVVFYVVGALMAAAIFGPRIQSMLSGG